MPPAKRRRLSVSVSIKVLAQEMLLVDVGDSAAGKPDQRINAFFRQNAFY